MMKKLLITMFITASLYGGGVVAQIPVEVFAGHEKASLDLMFFRFFDQPKTPQPRFLFFNRNRAVVDYRMTTTSRLPQFGFTEAISYNHPRTRGFAPVVVAQLTNNGIDPKAGIQFVLMGKGFTVFSWLVSELSSQANIDYYLLLRYLRPADRLWSPYAQLELLNTWLTATGNGQFTQRLRFGVSRVKFQFGIGTDLSERTNNGQGLMSNTGLFFRYEF